MVKKKKTVSHFMINENGSFNWYAPYIGVVSRRLDPQVLKRSLTVLVEQNARAGPAEPPA